MFLEMHQYTQQHLAYKDTEQVCASESVKKNQISIHVLMDFVSAYNL